MIQINSKVFRYEDIAYSLGTNEFDDPIPGYKLRLNLREFNVIKITPKGFWIKLYSFNSFDDKRFILNNSKKKFAHLTKKEALTSYKARKQRQIQILRGKLERAEKALNLVETYKGEKRCFIFT